MKIETLEELGAAFDKWRLSKRHTREKVPAALLERARRAVGVYDLSAVVHATKLHRSKFSELNKMIVREPPSTVSVPSFSRLELVAPVSTQTPLAEFHGPLGARLSIFTVTPELSRLLILLCGVGGHP